MGILNTYGRFFVPSLAPAVFNVAAILGVIALSPLFGRWGWPAGLALAVGAMVGGILQFGVQLPTLRRLGFRFRPEWEPRDPGLRRIAALMIPATIGQAATQINFLVDTWLGSLYGNGPITWLSLAFRLIQLPIGLFGVALGMANLARVSRDAATGDLPGLRANLAASLRAAALLALPASAGLIVLREPIVGVIFEHGRFDHASTESTAAALLCYALGLYAYAATKIQVPTFYALRDARLPVVAASLAVVAKLAANAALVVLLRRAGIQPFLALALSTSVAAWTHFAILAWGLRKRAGALTGHGVVRATLTMAAVSAAMAACCGGTYAGLARFLPGGGFGAELARLFAAIAVGAVAAASGALALRVPEARTLAFAVSRMARRTPRA
jgi:putative peptidoglycan lipid II flippase